MAVIQCLPGSGKSWLARRSPNVFVDVDVGIDKLGYKGRFDELLEDSSARNTFFAWYRENAMKKTLLSHFDPSSFRMAPPTLRVAYLKEDYVRHLREQGGREDLLKKFSVNELESWASDYAKFDNVIWLSPGMFLGDFLLIGRLK